MKPLEFAQAGEHEADDAATYYERQRAGLGGEFLEELQKVYDRIERNPRLCGRFKETEFRKCLLDRFPYTVYFLELDECIWVAAVAHQKRREGYWLDRSPQDD